MHLDPLSRDDLAAYIDSLALEQDIDLSLTARGTLDNLNLTMQVSATGLHEAVVEAGISMAEEAVLTSLSLQITISGVRRVGKLCQCLSSSVGIYTVIG